MIKTIIFDTDGMVIKREMYFSERFSKEFGVPADKVSPFFKKEFKLCLLGKADLKIELSKYLNLWNWKKSVEDLLSFWFEHESDLDKEMLESISALRDRGLQCYLDTNNEKYRVQYILKKLGLEKYFDGFFSSAEIGYIKEQPEFWSEVYRRLNNPDKSEVLVWDDGEENLKTVKDFGFNAELYSDFEVYNKRMKLLVG
jgi:putative hydrolase of the HAD superfamily